MAELTHPLSQAHTVHQHTDTFEMTNVHSSAINMSVLYRKGMWHWKLLLHVQVCYAAIHSGWNHRVPLLGWGSPPKKEKWGHHTTTDHKNTAIEDNEEGRVYRLENWDMKMILPLWGLIIVYAPGPFLSFSLPNQINHHRSPKPSLSLCSLFFFFFFHPPPPLSISRPLILLLIGLSEVSTSKRHLLWNSWKRWKKDSSRYNVYTLIWWAVYKI